MNTFAVPTPALPPGAAAVVLVGIEPATATETTFEGGVGVEVEIVVIIGVVTRAEVEVEVEVMMLSPLFDCMNEGSRNLNLEIYPAEEDSAPFFVVGGAGDEIKGENNNPFKPPQAAVAAETSRLFAYALLGLIIFAVYTATRHFALRTTRR
ncbi:hypothetical protein HD806DRAFT_513738 [Xylariaceae sp. AK1471]|nr:hypothetical protein HD806DRAFT_513738 [Xylariaceae sp. AK1471]